MQMKEIKRMEQILLQLDTQNLPFRKYRFSNLGSGLEHLGSGGYAEVFAAESRKTGAQKFAIKVIGFGEKSVSPKAFCETYSVQTNLEAGSFNIVKVMDYVQLRVSVDQENRISDIKILDGTDDCKECGSILLQFLVMEKLIPICVSNDAGKKVLFPEALQRLEKREVLKLAFDLGKALETLHKHKVLHRDVKLENVFYSEKEKKYKLGDFGIAQKTDYGVANESIYTKGYGAPEIVLASELGYDSRADIYSLGVLLYVLMNEFCLPGAEVYQVNFAEQYMSGYVFPEPKNKIEGLWEIVRKMCSFHPQLRYADMTEVLQDIEALLFRIEVKHKDADREFYRMLGWVNMIAGGILTFLTVRSVGDFRWQAIAMLSFGVITCMEMAVFAQRDEELMRLYYIKYHFGWMVVVLYGSVALFGITSKYFVLPFCADLLPVAWVYRILEYEPIKIGILGGCMSLFVCVRDMILLRIRR